MKHRRDRLSSAIREAAGKYLSDRKYGSSMVTVTSVAISEDLSKATVCVTIFPESQNDAVIKKLHRGRGVFANYVKKNTRIGSIPLLSFEIDRGEMFRQRIDELSSEVNNS